MPGRRHVARSRVYPALPRGELEGGTGGSPFEWSEATTKSWPSGLFALFIWFGLVLIKVDGATAFILGWVAGGAIFLFIRKFGETEPRTPRRSRARKR